MVSREKMLLEVGEMHGWPIIYRQALSAKDNPYFATLAGPILEVPDKLGDTQIDLRRSTAHRRLGFWEFADQNGTLHRLKLDLNMSACLHQVLLAIERNETELLRHILPSTVWHQITDLKVSVIWASYFLCSYFALLAILVSSNIISNQVLMSGIPLAVLYILPVSIAFYCSRRCRTPSDLRAFRARAKLLRDSPYHCWDYRKPILRPKNSDVQAENDPLPLPGGQPK